MDYVLGGAALYDTATGAVSTWSLGAGYTSLDYQARCFFAMSGTGIPGALLCDNVIHKGRREHTQIICRARSVAENVVGCRPAS